MKILAMTSTFESPLFPKLFDLHVYTRRPGSSAVVPGLDHDVVRAGSHFQVSIESFAVLLVLQPIIDVNLNGENGARAGNRSVNVNLLVFGPPESSRASIVIACDPGLNARVVFSELPPVWYFKAPLAYTSIVCTGLWPPALAWMANGDPTVAFDAGVLTITACD